MLVLRQVSNGKGGEWLRIDIDSWLVSLPENRRPEALDIIEPYVSVLRKKTNAQYSFEIPEALK